MFIFQHVYSIFDYSCVNISGNNSGNIVYILVNISGNIV